MSEAEISRLEKRLAREVAARKQAEQIAEKGLRDLFLANQNLDQRVTERTLELQSARTELELAALQREAFLASLSRQVRTPLNGVIGMLDLWRATWPALRKEAMSLRRGTPLMSY